MLEQTPAFFVDGKRSEYSLHQWCTCTVCVAGFFSDVYIYRLDDGSVVRALHGPEGF